jgi:hypothetical protein
MPKRLLATRRPLEDRPSGGVGVIVPEAPRQLQKVARCRIKDCGVCNAVMRKQI